MFLILGESPHLVYDHIMEQRLLHIELLREPSQTHLPTSAIMDQQLLHTPDSHRRSDKRKVPSKPDFISTLHSEVPSAPRIMVVDIMVRVCAFPMRY